MNEYGEEIDPTFLDMTDVSGQSCFAFSIRFFLAELVINSIRICLSGILFKDILIRRF